MNLSIFSEGNKKYIEDNFIIKCFDTRADYGRADDFMISFMRK